MTSAAQQKIPWNSQGFNLNAPFIYLILVRSATGGRHRYVGQATDRSRLRRYERNIKRILARKPRSSYKRNYRRVHLALVKAIEEGGRIKGIIIENCPKENLDAREKLYKHKYACDLNDRKGWHIKDYAKMAAEIQ